MDEEDLPILYNMADDGPVTPETKASVAMIMTLFAHIRYQIGLLVILHRMVDFSDMKILLQQTGNC